MKSQSPRGLHAIVVSAIVLGIVASLTGAHGQDKNGGVRIATIDMGRLENEDNTIKNFKASQDKMYDDLSTQLQTWQQNPFLTDAEQKQLGDLIIKDKSPGGLSGAEKKTRDDLAAKSKTMQDEFGKLQNAIVGQQSPADKTKLESYMKLGRESDTRVQTKQEEVKQTVQRDTIAIADAFQKRMKDALAKVAKDKNYSLVMNSQTAPYADSDCTNDVLIQLNKK